MMVHMAPAGTAVVRAMGAMRSRSMPAAATLRDSVNLCRAWHIDC
jgi:hypothetical protein